MNERVQQVINKLEALVDPFDLDVLKPRLKRNIIKVLQKFQVSSFLFFPTSFYTFYFRPCTGFFTLRTCCDRLLSLGNYLHRPRVCLIRLNYCPWAFVKLVSIYCRWSLTRKRPARPVDEHLRVMRWVPRPLDLGVKAIATKPHHHDTQIVDKLLERRSRQHSMISYHLVGLVVLINWMRRVVLQIFALDLLKFHLFFYETIYENLLV